MKKLVLFLMALLISANAYSAVAPDRRISDNDGDVLKINSDGTLPVTLVNSSGSAFTEGSFLFAGSGGVISEDNGSIFWDDTNNRQGLLTAAPTHTLTLGSTGTGYAQYNTVDQITNYERLRLYQSANIYEFTSEKGGSGTFRRAINISNGGTSGGALLLQSENLPYFFAKIPATTSAGSALMTFGMHTSGSLSASSGTQLPFVFSPTYNQTSTAGGYDVYINRTNTAVGSGVHAHLAMATGGTLQTVFKVNGPVRNVPSSTQTLSAGTATLANARVLKVTGNGGAITITAAPSIADGEEGDIIEIQGQSSTNTVAYQDQGTLASSNLRLAATPRTLGARDSLVLRYDGSDWVEISFSNVI